MYFIGSNAAKIEYSVFQYLSDGAIVLQIPNLFINQAAFLSVQASNPISWISDTKTVIGFLGKISELSNLFLSNITNGESIAAYASNQNDNHHHLNSTSNLYSVNGTIRLNYGNVVSKSVNISNCMASYPHPGGVPLTYKLLEGNFMNNQGIFSCLYTSCASSQYMECNTFNIYNNSASHVLRFTGGYHLIENFIIHKNQISAEFYVHDYMKGLQFSNCYSDFNTNIPGISYKITETFQIMVTIPNYDRFKLCMQKRSCICNAYSNFVNIHQFLYVFLII